MRIKNDVIDRIKAPTGLMIRNKLAVALCKSPIQISRYLDSNSDDLTKAAALKVIREETGLADDEILESNLVDAKG